MPDHAAYAPLFFLLARPVVEQAVGADVDLVCTATFLVSIPLGIVAIDSDAPRDWALWGVSLGLFLGSKYLALVLGPALLVLPLLRGPRRNALWAIPGFVVFGLPWYARNWIVAGSPIYPASLQVLGVVVARGAFARDAMNNSVFHVTSLRLLPAIVAHAFGAATALVWLPFACVGLAVFVARRRWWPGAYVAASLSRSWRSSGSASPTTPTRAFCCPPSPSPWCRSRSPSVGSPMERLPPCRVPDRRRLDPRRHAAATADDAALVHGRLALARGPRLPARRGRCLARRVVAACVPTAHHGVRRTARRS